MSSPTDLHCYTCGERIRGNLGLLAVAGVPVKCSRCRGEVPESLPAISARATAGLAHPMAYAGPAMRRAREELREAEAVAESAAPITDERTHEEGTAMAAPQAAEQTRPPDVGECGIGAPWRRRADILGMDLGALLREVVATAPSRLAAAVAVMQRLGVDKPSGYNRTMYLSQCLRGYGIEAPARWEEETRRAQGAGGAGIFLWALVQAGECCERGARRESEEEGGQPK